MVKGHSRTMMESMYENGIMVNNMAREHSPSLAETVTEGNGRKGNQMVWGHTLGLMEISMRENSRMGNNMVKEP